MPDNAVWLDLVNPTVEEDKLVERRPGIAVPTREEMQEIEISSRLYVENGARYMTATLMCAFRYRDPAHHAGHLHPCRSAPGDGSLRRAAAVCDGRATSWRASVRRQRLRRTVMMELLDAVIDRNADILERVGAEVDQVSPEMFEPSGAAGAATPSVIREILIAIGRKGDLSSKVRESLVSIGRVVTFCRADDEEGANGPRTCAPSSRPCSATRNR